MTLDDYYETSFLLDSELWAGLSSQIGPIAAVAPTRDVLLFGPSDSDGLVDLIVELRDDVMQTSPYLLSDFVFVWSDTGWQVLSE